MLTAWFSLGKVMGVANADTPRKSLVRPCAGLARVFSRPACASACVGLLGPAIAALPGPCSLSGSLDWLVCAKWQAACDFWRTGGMVILTTPYTENGLGYDRHDHTLPHVPAKPSQRLFLGQHR